MSKIDVNNNKQQFLNVIFVKVIQTVTVSLLQMPKNVFITNTSK